MAHYVCGARQALDEWISVFYLVVEFENINNCNFPIFLLYSKLLIQVNDIG